MVAYPVNWCENRLGDVCNYVNGTALEEYFSNYGNRRVISLGNYSEGGKYIDDGNRINLNQKTQSFLLYKDDLSMVLNDKGNGRPVSYTHLDVYKRQRQVPIAMPSPAAMAWPPSTAQPRAN